MSALETIRAKLSSLSVFSTDLGDLVRGIRANKKNPSKYISDQIQQIREELKQDDIAKKANAIQKLTYLQMLGYDMEWASFNVIEVMCCSRFALKRIGYLAASQSFTERTEVMVLCANLMRKDFGTKNMYNAAISLNCISNICNLDLARDIAADVLTMLTNSKPYLRKRAILTLYRIFVSFPDSLRPSFPRLRERLQDPEPAVVSSAVNVICELARKNPRNYISLAPTFFEILKTNTHNNWMLIKVIKLFGALAPIEQRLARLLVEPMHALINSTPATSLLYECINTCIAGLSAHLPTMKLCIGKLRGFIEDSDQNLKYLGLVALGNIMKVHPKAVAEHGDVILACLEDEDATIRARALELLSGIVNRKNMRTVIERLAALLPKAIADGAFRDDLLAKIVELCHTNQYQYITDFEWYLSILVEMARVPNLHSCSLIASQLTDVAIRVMVVRPYAARLMIAALRDPRFTASPAPGGACEVLGAAAWIVGEFYREAVCEVAPEELVALLLQPRVASLPAGIQATFMQSALKAFAKMTAGEDALKVPEDEEDEDEDEEPVHIDPATPEEIEAALTAMLEGLPVFTQSTHIEVQERACIAMEMVKLYRDCGKRGVDIGKQLFCMFDEALLPVSKAAQRKVPVPEGLDLDTPIYEDEPDTEDEADGGDDDSVFGRGSSAADDMEELRKLGEEYSGGAAANQQTPQVRRKKRVSDSPYILGGGDDDEEERAAAGDGVEDIPMEKITEDLGELRVRGSARSRVRKGAAAKRKPKVYKVMKIEENDEDEDEAAAKAERERRKAADGLANISLDEPLRPDESLPVAHHRVVTNTPKAKAAVAQKKQQQQKKGAAAAATPSPSKKNVAAKQSGNNGNIKRLCLDSNVSVAYEIKTNPKELTKVMAVMKITNRSKTAEVASVELIVPDTPAIQIAHIARVEKPTFTIKPGKSVLHQALFTFPAASASSGMAAKGKLRYTLSGSAATDLDFELKVPASAFIAPAQITKEQLAAVIKSAGAALRVATVQVKVQDPEQSGALAVAIAQGLLHLGVVAGTEGRHVYYGKTLAGGHHVAVLIRDKAATAGFIQVELKCGGDEVLVKSLTEEIKAFQF